MALQSLVYCESELAQWSVLQSTDRLSPVNVVAVGSCRLSAVGIVHEVGVVEVGRVRNRGVK